MDQNLTKEILTLLFLLLITLTHAQTWYVTPAGAGTSDGTSWANAAPGTNLQAIIDGASAGDEVWVSCGTFLPTTTTDRGISFHMRNGVEIYGSFGGDESSRTEREFACGPCSILSGEIGAAGNGDNSYTVVWNEQLDNTAILDGFIIRDGNDDRNATSDGLGLGGGIYNHGYGPTGSCHPVIRNCVFTANAASWGGGAFNNGYNQGDTEPTYINCIFSANHAYIEAGGMDSYGVGGNASPTVINTLFYGNTSATNVGAMYAWGGNSGGNCHPVLINCAFVRNRATNGYGGAFIADNLDENMTSSSGSCTVTLKNCIVTGNTATGDGQQFYVRGTGAQVLATYSYIDMAGQTGQNVIGGPGTGNIDEAPVFIDLIDSIGDDGCWMTADDGLALQAGSPGINQGDGTGVHTTDLTGSPRIRGSAVDIGPYEFPEGSDALAVAGFSSKLLIYPNPASEWLLIAGRATDLDQLAFFDMRGQQIEIPGSRVSPGKMMMDLREIPHGIYVINIGEATWKFARQ